MAETKEKPAWKKGGKQQKQQIKQKRQDRKTALCMLLIGIVIVLAVIYIAGIAFYSKHLYKGDTLFGVQVRNTTPAALKEQVQDKLASYTLTISTRTGEEQIAAEDIDLAYDDQGKIEQMLEEQNAFLWVTGLLSGEKTEQDVEVVYDEEKLNTAIEALKCMKTKKMEAPEDAYLTYSDGSFTIAAEKLGTTLIPDQVVSAVETAVVTGEKTLDLETADCYVAPKVFQDTKELVAEQTAVNKLIDVEITYDFSDRSEKVDRELISQWITFGDDFSYDLDEEKVTAYMKELGYKYDTFGLSREFTTSNGNTITVHNGDYGWLIGKTKSAQALIKKIKAGESGTIEPVYLYEGKSRNKNDIGDTYIEVSIADQEMWCYVDGKLLVSTPIISGLPVAGRETPSDGVWAIDAKMTDYYLTGQGYNSHVDYWMPFNGNVGIHDASWQDSFGGSVYKSKGSHGCINTPYNAVKEIYENVSIGTAVVVY